MPRLHTPGFEPGRSPIQLLSWCEVLNFTDQWDVVCPPHQGCRLPNILHKAVIKKKMMEKKKMHYNLSTEVLLNSVMDPSNSKQDVERGNFVLTSDKIQEHITKSYIHKYKIDIGVFLENET